MVTGDEYFENLLKCTISYTGERNIAQNIFYMACTAAHGAGLTALTTLAQDIATEFSTEVMPQVSNSVYMDYVTVADWTDATGLTGIYDINTRGGLSGEVLPAQVCTLLNYQTNLRYRGGRGRLYLPQPSTAQLLNDTTWTSTFIGDVEAAIATFFGFVNEQTLSSAGMNWVLYHRGTTNVAQGFEDVLAITCNQTPGTQRRRVRRVGHKR